MRIELQCSAAFLLLFSNSFALETKPWFGEVYEFNFQSDFSYSRFSKIEGASKQLKSPLNDFDFLFDLGFTLSESIDFQVEVEVVDTSRTSFTFSSGAMQARYRLLDDISGDPVSLVFGLNLRGVTHRFLRDVSAPYAADFDAELICSVGREWSKNGFWTMRTYAFMALGQANQGYPWTRDLLVWQWNLNDIHRLTLFAEVDVGFGGRQHVDVNRFSGWGKFQHQSIDLGLAYGYKIGFYGVLTASYAHRVFAHNFPEHVNCFTLSYHLPFSLF